jgi:uncharacterized protein (DUF488 family)
MQSEGPKAERTVWTIGHSNQPLEKFLDLLRQHRITLLVDVRSSPYSQYASYFNREAIQPPLRAQAVDYLFLGDLLGGRAEGGQFYDAEGYALYDRLAQSPEFRQGVDRLLKEMQTARLALMCGEEDPTNCHRRLLVGRVLHGRGVKVMHIRAGGAVQSEEEVAAEERFQKTKGQLTLFDIEEPHPWKSTRSVLPRKQPPSSSRSSSRPESGR